MPVSIVFVRPNACTVVRLNS